MMWAIYALYEEVPDAYNGVKQGFPPIIEAMDQT